MNQEKLDESMKVINQFLLQCKASGRLWRFITTIIIGSFLYSMMYAFINMMIFQGYSIAYAILLYVFVVWSTLLYMVVVAYMMNAIRHKDKKLEWKSYVWPTITVQTVYFLSIAVLSFLAFQARLQTNAMLLLVPLIMIFALLYIVWQLHTFMFIYDGMKNPFKILWHSLVYCIKHYQKLFYAFLIIASWAILYQVGANAFFNNNTPFQPSEILMSLQLQSSPFIDGIRYMLLALQNAELWRMCIYAFFYGIVQCILFTCMMLYMIFIYNEEIKVRS